MINALQIIVRIPLFSVNFPANVQLCFGILVDVTNFNLFSTDASTIFKFTPTDPYSANFDAIGYNSMNSIENMQSLFYYMWVIPIIYIIV